MKAVATCPRLIEFRQGEHWPSIRIITMVRWSLLVRWKLKSWWWVLLPDLTAQTQTNRPFTGDYAGDLLYPMLKKYGWAEGDYQRRKDDGFRLINVRMTNSVRCVPPQNKVTGDEVKNCGAYLTAEIASVPNPRAVLTLGSVAHNAVLSVLGYKKSAFKFTHNGVHRLDRHNLWMVNSYHTSRYNVNTGVLTEQMFEDVLRNLQSLVNK